MTNAEALNLLNSVEGYNKTQVSESAMTFEKGGLSLKVFYVEAQDCFGFTMLNGGNKACKTFEEFKTMLDTYFFINITFIPNAKSVANIFQNAKAVGVAIAYNSFKGSANSGWIAVFNVLGDDTKEIQVKLSGDIYHAGFLDKSANRLICDRTYLVDEAGNVTLEKTLKNFFSMLCDYYADSEEFDIDRNSESEYIVTHNNDTIQFKVVIENNAYKFICNDSEEYLPKNPFDLSELFNNFFSNPTDLDAQIEASQKEFAEENLKANENIDWHKDDDETPADTTNEVSEDDDDEDSFHFPTTEDDTSEDAVETSESLNTESVDDTEDEVVANETSETAEENVNTEEVSVEETTEEPVKTAEEVEEVEAENSNIEESVVSITKEEENNMDFELMLIVDEEKTTGVLICYPDKLLKCDIEAFKETGFPIESITSITDKVIHRGVAVTEEEVSRKRFAKDITSDAEAIKSVVDDFFS